MSEISDSRTPREDGAEDQHSLGHLFKGWLRTVLGGRDDNTLRETIEELIEEQDGEEGSMGAGERALLANILKLRDRSVADVMVPRADIAAVEVDTSMSALVHRMADEAHSRLPVYRETLDDVVGMVHIKDVIAAVAGHKPVELKDIVRDLTIVAPSMPVVDLLVQMRQKRQHMALVVDEFGGIDGLVTIEDLVEEIVGEIEDEHDDLHVARLVERADGTLLADARVAVEHGDGADVPPGGTIATVTGRARALLTGERTALNLLGRLSGIATATRALVRAVEGTNARIVCTRKTTAGLRVLEKQAVRLGGGFNHRFGLDDAVLIKDNHIAVAGGIRPAVERVRATIGHMVKVEVEVDTLAQLEELLTLPADVVLLDNMDPETLRCAVAMVDGRMLTEASGNVTLSTVRAIAEAGVDMISVGWITHSAPNLDIGLDM